MPIDKPWLRRLMTGYTKRLDRQRRSCWVNKSDALDTMAMINAASIGRESGRQVLFAPAILLAVIYSLAGRLIVVLTVRLPEPSVA